MELSAILRDAVESRVSDIYIIPGSRVMVKRDGVLGPEPGNAEKVTPQSSEELIKQIYHLDRDRDMDRLYQTGDDDFSFSLNNVGRFRCNAYKQRGSLASVLRVVPFGLPDPDSLEIPAAVMALCRKRRGMILVTGPAGSGKTTTLACMIDRINQDFCNHIITIEDPIEYLHPHKTSVVSQREIQHDTENYQQALRAALRQAPDVILLGEMRDFETMQTALTAANTGHLLFSTLHTVGASKTIDRIIDVFPANQQQQVRVELSMVLQAVISQQLIPTLDGKLVPAFELMAVNSAIQNIIREGKTHQLDNVIFSGAAQGMTTMDAELFRLCKSRRISRANALLYALNPDALEKRLAAAIGKEG